MAQELRLVCGKCGVTIKLVARERITQKEGDKMGITCGQAQNTFPSMQGCTDSELILQAIVRERPLEPTDVVLEEFVERATKKAEGSAPEKAPEPPPGSEEEKVGDVHESEEDDDDEDECEDD